MSLYLESITEILSRIDREDSAALAAASDAVSDVICGDGLVYVFGCGHSHLVALDTFYRAGGLACVSALLDEDLMLHDGAAKADKVKTVAISSSAYKPHGGVLLDEADIGIDSKVAYGDAVIPVGDAAMGGMSTFAGLFILNSILIEGAKKALARGVTPPIYRSGNVEGGTAQNALLEAKYFNRIKRL